MYEMVTKLVYEYNSLLVIFNHCIWVSRCGYRLYKIYNILQIMVVRYQWLKVESGLRSSLSPEALSGGRSRGRTWPPQGLKNGAGLHHLAKNSSCREPHHHMGASCAFWIMNLCGQRLGNCEPFCIHLDTVHQEDFAIFYKTEEIWSFCVLIYTTYYWIISVYRNRKVRLKVFSDQGILRDNQNLYSLYINMSL